MCMKGFFKKVYNLILSKMPLSDVIVFESNPDFACNTYPVYQKIIETKELKDYKKVWFLHKMPNDDFQGRYILDQGGIFHKIKEKYYLQTSRCLVSCNRLLGVQRKGQLSVFLSHGSKTKKTKGICEIGTAADYVLCQAHFFDDIITYEYGLKKEQLVYFGYPRCDCFYQDLNYLNIKKQFGMEETSKYMVWLPTFRTNQTYANQNTESQYKAMGMPLVYSIEELNDLNLFLKEENVHIVYKPHFAQDVSVLKASSLSNIHVIDDDFLKKKGLQLYQVLAKSVALITDYSSVFFDYLLLNQPIATTTDDIEEWKKKRGFAFDLEAMYDKATTRVPNKEELKKFVKDTINGVDAKEVGRQEIRDLTNLYQDGNATKRTVDFIVEKLKTKEGDSH